MRFLDTLLKGFGQVLVCLNPVTGFFLCAAIFVFSWEAGFLTVLGVLSATLTGRLLGARTLHLEAGVYGFNGCVLGIAWLSFFRLNFFSVVLLVLFCSFSSVINRLLLRGSRQTRSNLPVFSIPALLLIWAAHALLLKTTLLEKVSGPDLRIVSHWRAIYYFAEVWDHPHWGKVFAENFGRWLPAAGLIYAGIRMHSKLSARCVVWSTTAVLGTVTLLGGAAEFKNVEFYFYNAVPCAVALGGTFLAWNRRVAALAAAASVLTAVLTFFGLRHFPVPVFVAPFNAVTIFFIWLAKSGRLKKENGFLAVPMDLVSTPELGIEWQKGELYAEQYWLEIKGWLPRDEK